MRHWRRLERRSQNVHKFPQINQQTGKYRLIIPTAKRLGWRLAFGMKTWAEGNDVEFDYCKSGQLARDSPNDGRKASGPDPLRRLLISLAVKYWTAGKKTTTLDVHDYLYDWRCGGRRRRRSAMISLSDFDDQEFAIQEGANFTSLTRKEVWLIIPPFTSKPTNVISPRMAGLMSGSGERGIFNRGGLAKQFPERRIKLQTNMAVFSRMAISSAPSAPILAPKFYYKANNFVIFGSGGSGGRWWKSLLKNSRRGYSRHLPIFISHFPIFLRVEEHCDEERCWRFHYQWDCPVVRQPEVLEKLRKEAIKVNQTYAKRFGISASTAITCVKPSGTLSQMVDCSSGMHPRHSQYYIRRIRIAATDSLFKMLKDQGVPYSPEVGQAMESATTFVLEFPVKAPANSIFKDDLTAIEQLEHWKIVKTKYTEHNPSVTISVGDDEWIAVADWLYKNWDIIGGLSFLPRDNHVYQLAPYEPIDEKNITKAKRLAHLDFSKIISTKTKRNWLKRSLRRRSLRIV